MSYRLAIVETHPIQYKAPWFRRLAAQPGLEIEVFFAMVPDAVQQGEGFGVSFTWDLPFREGYPSRVLRNVSRHPSVVRFNGCDTPELYGLIRDGNWDAVLVNGWVVKTCMQALLACRLARVPCIVRGESNAMRPRAMWKKWIHRALLSQYARVLYIGKSNHEFYRSNGVSESRLFFGPYGVDNEYFMREATRLRPCRVSLRQRWGIPESAFCVLFSGKLIEKKHPMDLLRGLKSVVMEQGARAVHVLMAGDGELRVKCEGYVREQRLPVTFAGFLNQQGMPQAYAVADCLVLPSDHGETWGLVVNEAMASGLPVILSDRVGCHPDLVQPGVTGFVFPFGQIEILAAIIRELMRRNDGGDSMGRAAQARVADYSVARLVEGTLDVLKSLRLQKAEAGGRPC